MKKLSGTVVLVMLFASAALAGNYTLKIDGKKHEIDLGAKTTVTLADGRKVEVELEKKTIADFKTNNFSFSHPSHVTPSRTDLGDGIHQTMMATPSGTMVMIQEYSGTNPSGLVDFMLTELLKEEAEYGYDIIKTAASKQLADGKTMTGKRAVSKHRTDEYERYVLCYGIRDAGVLILTQVEKAASRQDLTMIDLFWKSLQVTIK
jgi:hypothetical protein